MEMSASATSNAIIRCRLQLKPKETTKLKDVALLCSNCHRIVHRRRPWLRMKQLSRLLRAQDHALKLPPGKTAAEQRLQTQMEPHRLTRWRAPGFSADVQFYTSARPGRSYGKEAIVADSIVDEWVQGLPGRTGTTIVSLLGRKPKGTSEFSFDPFHGGWDTDRSAVISRFRFSAG